MPFDSSGNFTRSYNWVDDRNAGVKIEATRMDGEFDNYAAAMNQTFMRSGIVPMTGDLNMHGNTIYNIGGGTLNIPGMRFTNDASTGITSLNAGEVSLVSNGTEIIRSTSIGAIVNGDLGVTGGMAIAGGDCQVLGGGSVVISAPNNFYRSVIYYTDGNNRWSVDTDTATEAGANSGSNFDIARYNDAGDFIDNVLTISRATGIATFTHGITQSAVGSVSQINIDGPPSSRRILNYSTNGLSRWQFEADSTPEATGNVGSNLVLRRYDNTGTYIDEPLVVTRNNGAVNVTSNFIVNGSTALYGVLTVNSSAGITGALSVGGITTLSGQTYVNYSIGAGFPTINSGLSISINHVNTDVDFWNTNTASTNSFAFYQMNTASTATLLMKIANNATTIFGNASITGTLSVTGTVTFGAATFTSLTISGALTAGTITSNGQVTINSNILALTGPANNGSRYIQYQTAGLPRWYHGLTTTPEASGAGADFFIARANDAGAYIDQPLTIYRNTGNAIFSNALSVVGNIACTAGGIYAQNGVLAIDGPINTSKVLYFQNATSTRWTVFANGATEAGGNVGSDFFINYYNDAGSSPATALSIQRNDGFVRVNTPPANDNSTKVATTAYVQAAVGTGGGAANQTAVGTLAGPVTTVSTTAVFVGMNRSIIPLRTGRVMVTVTGDVFNNTGASTNQMQLMVSPTANQAPPAQFAPSAGNTLSASIRCKTNAAGIWFPFSITGIITGLTLGVGYWADLTIFTSIAANACNVQDLTILMVEL